MLADRYPDDAERGKAMGIVLSGFGLGVLSKSITAIASALSPADSSWTTLWRVHVPVCGQSIPFPRPGCTGLFRRA